MRTGPRRLTRGAAILAAVIFSACSGPGGPASPARPSPAEPSDSGLAGGSAAPTAALSPTPGALVGVIVMENRGYTEAIAQPYIGTLASKYTVATQYFAVSHPSLPNYLALTAGSTFDITDDAYHRLPTGGLGHELTAAAVPWHAYMEGMSRGCLDSPFPYAVKHNPFAYYGGSCPANVTSAATLPADLAGGASGLVWVTPDLCNDGHDCSTSTGDRWLSSTVPMFTASPRWQAGGALFIVWDEDDGGGDNRVVLLAITPHPGSHTIGGHFDHYSLLATVEDLLGVPRLGRAVGAASLPVQR
ncbi:MAG TPA: alkaline phosphatase family protein [Candidatus Dormibacteraeota bacterium]|nr:alkaline phosphatase family protein [Candidatus Dormibacteraeota bacterium]